MGYIIRRRNKEDIKNIAHVTTLAWNQTYKGIVKKEFLDSLKINEEERIKKSLENFDENNNNTFVLEVSGKVVGFAKCVISDYPGYEGIGEIQAIYILDGYKGYGYGRALFETCIKHFKNSGQTSMLLNCLDGNKTNYFYIHMGGKKIGTINLHFGDDDYNANVYFFENI